MTENDAFGRYHPLINFSFFTAAMLFGMLVRHPAFQAVSVACAALYYLSVRRAAGLKTLAAMVPLFAVLSLLNPLFNPMGDTVLFTYANGRAYTWESLCFGMSTAAMLVSMLLWFAGYNAVMTNDKFTYLFGTVAPSLSLVLSMVLRLVPSYRRKAGQLATARAGVGKSVGQGGARARAKNGAALLSALVTWAFEHGVTTADSMRARGFGSTRRTSFAVYRFGVRDGSLLAVLVALAVAAALGMATGAADAAYLPSIALPPTDGAFYGSLCAYAAFLALPLAVNVKEELWWRISLSRI